MMNNAIATVNKTSQFKDLDNLPAEDVVTPKTFIINPSASFVQNEDKLSDGTVMKGGMIYNKSANSIINGKEVIILNYKNVFRRTEKDGDMTKTVYVSDTQDEKFLDGAIFSGLAVNALKSKQFLCVVDGDFDSLVIVDYTKSSFKHGKFVVADAKNHGDKFVNSKFVFDTEKKQKTIDGKTATWYEMKHEWVGNTSAEELEEATKLKALVEGFAGGVKEKENLEEVPF